MKFLYTIFCLYLFIPVLAQAQLYSGTGTVRLSAAAPFSMVEGTSAEATGAMHLQNQKLYFEVPVSSFLFSNYLVQEHFQDKYMHSKRYPKATFAGTLTRNGNEAEATGTLTIHGVGHQRTIQGILEEKNGQLLLHANFTVNMADHQIQAPRLTSGTMSETVTIDLQMPLKPQQGSRQQLSMLRRIK